MQSVSPSPRFGLALLPGRMWDRTRASMAGGQGWSALLILLLALMIARSTATAAWVGGIDVVTAVALGGALVMGALAVAAIPWAAGLSLGLIAAPVVAAVVAGPALRAVHPGDTLSIGLVGTWWSRLSTGSAPGDPFGYSVSADPAFYLFLICMLMWVTGGWLSWCVLRWRRPMLGLVPGAAAFATNLLNYPADQNGYTLAILVLTLALLLWTNYTSSIANATRARVKLTGDARWDFWESGLVAMAALIVLAILLPPLSTVDRTIEVSSTAFSSWAKLQQRLSHPAFTGRGNQGAGTTGFSTEVKLSGPLKKTHEIVFTYTFTSSSGPRYFRGVNETSTFGGEWRYPTAIHLTQRIGKNQVPQYAEDYQKLALTLYQVNMVSPPVGNSDILFYPGVLWRADRESVASEVILPFVPSLMTIDRLSSVVPPVSSGKYIVTTEYSTATDADLKEAGTAYPDWLSSYSSLPPSGYRSKEVMSRIHQLALDITEGAGAVTPYDKAKAIETYLRTNYTYTLDVTTPNGVDPLAYFLFDSKKGYCEFFASAMGDMLRSLGIPTRLVNGFGPGNYDTATNAWIVRGEDAHTWVETYFPSYGWIPFEPTPDQVYTPIPRGSTGTNTCLRDSNCDNPGTAPGGVAVPSTKPGDIGGPLTDPGLIPGGGPGFTFRAPDAGTLTRIAGVLLALVLLVFAVTARYLRPRKVATVWKRTLVLARLAGAERRTGETPFELARRLAHTFPEASGPVRSLADGFVVSAYAPPDLAGSARASVMEAWAALRPVLLRRVASRLHLTRA
jgi:transglutaminase-like putative cysteine protease